MAALPARGWTAAGEGLDEGFRHPPDSARPWVYWWWLNGYASREGIVRDLDEMKRQGIAGVLVFNAGGGPTPRSIPFMSPEWRELFRFASVEAGRRGISVSLNLCSGWNAGGPWVKAEDAAQSLVFTEARMRGPRRFDGSLPAPARRDNYYRDIAVLAWGRNERGTGEVWRGESMVDLSGRMDGSGRLRWDVPHGDWLVLRLGHTLAPRGRTKFVGGSDGGYEVDPFRSAPMDAHFAATAGQVLTDGSNLQAVGIDSWEMGRPDWTPAMRAEFQSRRGYDPSPYLAVLAGKTVDSREASARFREDFDRTLGDLTAVHYYGRLAELAHRHGLLAHPEAAGYQKAAVDSLQAMGRGDMTMGEFWARVSEPAGYAHQATPAQLRFHDSIKLASSAAHIYGRALVMGEAFTVYHPDWVHWNQYPYALKDIGDRAFCQGLNRNVLCFYVHQPDVDAPPGYQWPGCGTNFDRYITWWPMIHAWLLYLARCQYLLEQGRFVADACYFYGESVPNFVPARHAMEPPLPPGFDCDSIDGEALATRLGVENGRLTLPDGMSYRLLALPSRTWSAPPQAIFRSEEDAAPWAGNGLPVAMSAAALRKIERLAQSGATVVGPRPVRAPGLHGDAEVNAIADRMWGGGASGERRCGKGRVIWGKSLGEIFAAARIAPDFEVRGGTGFDWIHRTADGAEIYFISNQTTRGQSVDCVFRVAGKQPELWDPVTGEIRDLPGFPVADGRTRAPMEFAPRQSFFVVFRKPAGMARSAPIARIETLQELKGPWQVAFDPKRGGPGTIEFERLEDWTKRSEEGVRHYSGTARYRLRFDCARAAAGGRLYLDLGSLCHVAEVRLNGRNLGVVWTAPWRVEATEAIREKDNLLEIDVANLWPNRLIGDAALPPDRRVTKTNVTVFKPGDPLLASGLLGPVTIRRAPGA